MIITVGGRESRVNSLASEFTNASVELPTRDVHWLNEHLQEKGNAVATPSSANNQRLSTGSNGSPAESAAPIQASSNVLSVALRKRLNDNTQAPKLVHGMCDLRREASCCLWRQDSCGFGHALPRRGGGKGTGFADAVLAWRSFATFRGGSLGGRFGGPLGTVGGLVAPRLSLTAISETWFAVAWGLATWSGGRS